jgi:hypothetical protein
MSRVRARLAMMTLVAMTLAGCASTMGTHDSHQAHQASAHDQAHMHADRPLSKSIQTAHPCRAGAFVEASSIVNSVVEIAMALPPTTSERTRAELDTVLYTALKQAKSEVHCVVGALSFGYDRAYAGVIKRGVGLAQSRRLSKDIVDLGNEIVATLEANKRVDAPAVKQSDASARETR